MTRYQPVTEKPYCCVPAVIQMIQARKGLPVQEQEDIGYELGLIVPEEERHHFRRVRTGAKPAAGYGTQTGLPDFSLDGFLMRQPVGLRREQYRPVDEQHLASLLLEALANDHDVVLCFDSQELFADGDIEHVALVDAFDRTSQLVTIIDPAIGAPKVRTVSLSHLYRVLSGHEVSDRGGLWIIF